MQISSFCFLSSETATINPSSRRCYKNKMRHLQEAPEESLHLTLQLLESSLLGCAPCLDGPSPEHTQQTLPLVSARDLHTSAFLLGLTGSSVPPKAPSGAPHSPGPCPPVHPNISFLSYGWGHSLSPGHRSGWASKHRVQVPPWSLGSQDVGTHKLLREKGREARGRCRGRAPT